MMIVLRRMWKKFPIFVSKIRNMKNIVFAFSLLVLVMFCSQRGFARIQKRPDGCPLYKSIIRLWPKHHEDEELSRQLIEAFRQWHDFDLPVIK